MSVPGENVTPLTSYVSDRIRLRIKSLALRGATIEETAEVTGVGVVSIGSVLNELVTEDDLNALGMEPSALKEEIAKGGLSYGEVSIAKRAQRANARHREHDSILEIKRNLLGTIGDMVNSGQVRSVTEAVNAFKVLDSAKVVPMSGAGNGSRQMHDVSTSAAASITVNYVGFGGHRSGNVVLDDSSAVVGFRNAAGEVTPLGNVTPDDVDAMARASGKHALPDKSLETEMGLVDEILSAMPLRQKITPVFGTELDKTVATALALDVNLGGNR